VSTEKSDHNANCHDRHYKVEALQNIPQTIAVVDDQRWSVTTFESLADLLSGLFVSGKNQNG